MFISELLGGAINRHLIRIRQLQAFAPAPFTTIEGLLSTMEGLRWGQMSESERDQFLGTGGTGTLSFSTEIEEFPFSLPVSYGYSADGATFYFRLSLPPDSGKKEVIDNPITFVTHEQTDDGWQSVIAKGQLTEVSDMPYDSTIVQAMWAVEIPEVDIFDRPPEEMVFHQYRLDPEKLTGRKEAKHDS